MPTYSVVGECEIVIDRNSMTFNTTSIRRSKDRISIAKAKLLIESIIEGIGSIIDDPRTDIVMKPGQIAIAKLENWTYGVYYNGFGSYIFCKDGPYRIGTCQLLPKSDFLKILKTAMNFIDAILI